MNETEKKVVDDVASVLLSVAGALNRDGFISREDMRTLLATQAEQLGALLTANGTDETAGTNETPAEDREHMSRAEATRILMQLQRTEARCGHGNVNAALEMGLLMKKKFWTVDEAAKALRLSPSTIRYHVRKGRLQSVRIPGSSRSLGIVADDIAAIIAGKSAQCGGGR